jgi:hypothetical protein
MLKADSPNIYKIGMKVDIPFQRGERLWQAGKGVCRCGRHRWECHQGQWEEKEEAMAQCPKEIVPLVDDQGIDSGYYGRLEQYVP